jgi:hypothetical protein
MTKHYIDIDGAWAFILAYDIELGDLDEIASWLEALGSDEESISKACRVALGTNSGFTFSSEDLRMSVMAISNASSVEQWLDTLAHEIDHLQGTICRYYDVELDTEEAAYLQGYIMKMCVSKIKTERR